jgi:hypothetical protein
MKRSRTGKCIRKAKLPSQQTIQEQIMYLTMLEDINENVRAIANVGADFNDFRIVVIYHGYNKANIDVNYYRDTSCLEQSPSPILHHIDKYKLMIEPLRENHYNLVVITPCLDDLHTFIFSITQNIPMFSAPLITPEMCEIRRTFFITN